MTACAIADSQHVASDLQNSNFEVAQRSLQQYDDEQYAEDYFGDIGDFDPGQDIDLIDDETPQKGASPASDSKAAGTPAKVSKSKRTKKETTKNKIIEFAPEAEVKWGDDIDDEGKHPIYSPGITQLEHSRTHVGVHAYPHLSVTSSRDSYILL